MDHSDQPQDVTWRQPEEAGSKPNRLTVTRRSVLAGTAALGIAGLTIGTGSGPAAAEAPGATIVLAAGGHTPYKIFLADKEDVVAQQAAQELKAYLESITSAKFDLVVAATPPDTKLIIVGRNNPVALGAAGIDYAKLGDDGFALRTPSPQTVLIAGGSSRGTLYGVYWLLDHLLGVRWYAPDVTMTPYMPKLAVPQRLLNGDQLPQYRFRQSYFGDAQDPAYRQHNLLNGGNGFPTSPNAGINTWSTYWPDGSFGGTFHTLVPDQTLWAGGQLACMDPRTREIAAENLVDMLKKKIAAGQDPSYGFTQQDAGSWPMDADSQAFADAHGGSPAAPVTDMVNDVLARVRKEIPDARVSSQAYQFDFAPPTGIKPSNGVIMTVAPIDANFGQSLFAGDNQGRGADIAGWCGISDDVVLWDYVTSFANYIIPFPDWWAMCEGIKQLATLHSASGLGYFGEGAYNASGTEFSQLRTWVISRLLWDPTLNADALIREFVHGYYGSAGKHVYQYMQSMVQSVADTSTFLSEGVNEYAGYFTFDAMRRADQLLDQAEAAVAHDTTLVTRVRTVRLGVDYVILVRTTEYQQQAADEGVIWNPDTANRLARFTSELATSGLTQYTEGGGTPEELLTKVRVAAAPATPPQAVEGLPETDWRDYQEASFSLYLATIAADARGSNGYSVSMPGNIPDWGVQLKLSLLPADGTWKLYVSVAADTGTADPSATAMQAGVYPPFDDLINIPVSSLSDGAFHEIALPGTYQNDSSAYVYIAPPNSSAISKVYVDRVFAVKA